MGRKDYQFAGLCRNGSYGARCKADKLNLLHRKPYAEVEQIVREHGWSLVTTESTYRNASRISVRCPNGHRSTRTVHDFRRRRGCRSCYARVGENAVRAVFESVFHTDFPLKHPHWLTSSRGGRLELDGYSPELGLAFEYQGFRHYRERKSLRGELCFSQAPRRGKGSPLRRARHHADPYRRNAA